MLYKFKLTRRETDMVTTVTQGPLVNSRLSQLAKTRMSRNSASEEFYVLVAGTGGLVDLSDADNAETVRIFRNGSCVAFAYAASLVTGFPVVLFTATETGHAWSGHAAVQLPTGEFLDIAGANSLDEVNSYFGFTGAACTPTVYETLEDAHALLNDPLTETGVFGYLLANVNELGLLVTFHFVEQLLSYYDLPFDVKYLRKLEKATVAYARKKSRT